MRDGVGLFTDVVTPAGGGRHPVVIYRTPYGRQGCWQAYAPERTAASGWVVLVQDVRGRFGSEGTFDPFAQEGRDSADTVEWAHVQPWSSGAVFMGGASYIGFTQWLGAVERPRGLRGITPMISGADFHEGWASEQGVPYRSQLDVWSINVARDDPRITAAKRRRAVRLFEDPPAMFDPPEAPSPAAAIFPEHERWMHPRPDRDVRHITWRRRPPEVPVFQVTGWFDPMVESALAGWEALIARGRAEVRASSRLVVGPWGHNGQMPRRTGEVDYGSRAHGLREGVPAAMRAWMDELARGDAPTGGVRVFLLGAKRWAGLDAWPPPSTTRRLHLAPGGRLAVEAPAAEEVGRFACSPADPVPTNGGRHMAPPPWPPGQLDQAPLDARTDILRFRTARLAEPLHVVGNVRLTLRAEAAAEEAVVTAKLIDVDRHGVALNVVEGSGLFTFTPGTPRRVDIDVGRIAAVFRTGHRVRLDVSWSSYPRLGFTDRPSACPGTLVLHGGGRHPAALDLPEVAPGILQP